MPPPALKSLANKAGKSLKDAERYWSDAKNQVKPKTDSDYQKVMGIVKKRLGLPTKSVEGLVRAAELGACYRYLIEAATGGDVNIRTFFDSGFLQFCTPEDVMIEAGVDSRIDTILNLVNDNDWPSDHPMMDQLDSYEGSLDKLYTSVLQSVKLPSD